MHDLIDVVRRELRFILNTPALLLLLFLAPMLYPFLYSYLYVNKFERNVPVVVCDLDGSQKSRAFIRMLDATEAVQVTGTRADPAECRSAIEAGNAEGAVIIDRGFERDLLRNARPVIRVFINSTRFMPVSDIGKGIGDAVAQTGTVLLTETLALRGIPREMARHFAAPVLLQTNSIANTTGSYGDFMIPAILLLVLQQTLLAGTAVAAAGIQRRSRTVPRGMPVVTWLVGKAIPYFVIYGIYAAAFFTIHYHIWHIPFEGNVPLLALLTGLHFAVIIASGFLVGSFCRSHLTAMIICVLSTYPIFLLSGIPWPVQCMPEVFRVISPLLPSTWFIPAAFSAARLDAGWTALQLPFFILALTFVIIGTAVCLIIRFRELKTADA